MARHAPAHGHSNAAVDAATAEVFAAFDAAGIAALLLKGPGLETLLYGAGEHRHYSDTDVLVPPGHLDAAEKTLAARGYVNADRATGVDDVGGVVNAHTWIRTAFADQSMVDLHRWLYGAKAAPAAAWEALSARCTTVQVGGRPVPVLGRPGQAMHLALHAAQHGSAHTRPIDELALALERWPPDVWDGAAQIAREIDATMAFAAGLRLLPQGAAEASRLGLPATAELDWKVRHRATRPRGTFHVDALAQATGLAERLRILRRALLPSRAWIRHEHPSARQGGLRLIAAYARHLARAPAWAARAWGFRRRARRAGRPR